MMPDNVLLQQLIAQQRAFAVYPEVRILESPGGKSIQHLLFGDFITPPKRRGGREYEAWSESSLIQLGEESWIRVRSRQEEGFVRLQELQVERTLEVNFIDVGQGDGCHLVTPTDEHFIIDAGEKDNMYRFLRWRFNLSAAGKSLPKFHAVISHPDEDHYGGFIPLLADIPPDQKRTIVFDQVFHNGIVQQAGNSLGETKTVGEVKYLSEIFHNDERLRLHLASATKQSRYEKLLHSAHTNYPDIRFQFTYASPASEKYLYEDSKLKIRILGPVPQVINGEFLLPWFDINDSIGKTKNGHSIVMMAQIRNLKVFLGGDLNSSSSDYIMEQYSGINLPGLRKASRRRGANIMNLTTQMDECIALTAKHFRADVAKCCHHGSHDITNEFLRALNPIATVISSGDEESFCHPRPETLGAIGKYSRGERPLLYSTELARSSPEYIEIVRKNLLTDKVKQKVVSVYGMITLRSDGEKVVIAQKLEKPSSTFGNINKWQLEKLVWDDTIKDFLPDR